MSDNLYYSVRVTRILLCSCAAFKFPHSLSSGLCESVKPDDLESIPCRVSPTAMKRAKDLIRNGYL